MLSCLSGESKVNAKKRRKLDSNSVRLVGRARAQLLGLSSNSWVKEHASEKKGEKQRHRCRCFLTRPGQRVFILESEGNKDR